MSLPIENNWFLFSIIFGLMLVVTFFMNKQGLNFFTKDVLIRKFSIMDVELPATAVELKNLIDGLYKLPHPYSSKAVNALKGQLYLDFLFMPFAYGSIFLLCLRVADKMQLPIGGYVFNGLAVLQLLAWLCDIIENIYLLNKIRPETSKSSDKTHTAYLFMQAIKWGIALTGAVCSISAVCYFWLAHLYAPKSLTFLLIVLAEIIIFFIAQKAFLKEKEVPHE